MFSESSSDKLNFDFQNLTAVVVSLKNGETTHEEIDYSVSEIIQLAKTLGVTIKNKFIQSRKFIDSAYYIGQGKLEEIRLYMTENNIDILIFGDNKIDCEELTVPHKLMWERDFVMIPLNEIKNK